jgi:hypothetical protein
MTSLETPEAYYSSFSFFYEEGASSDFQLFPARFPYISKVLSLTVRNPALIALKQYAEKYCI